MVDKQRILIVDDDENISDLELGADDYMIKPFDS